MSLDALVAQPTLPLQGKCGSSDVALGSPGRLPRQADCQSCQEPRIERVGQELERVRFAGTMSNLLRGRRGRRSGKRGGGAGAGISGFWDGPRTGAGAVMLAL